MKKVAEVEVELGFLEDSPIIEIVPMDVDANKRMADVEAKLRVIKGRIEAI